jgi:hypothetical protein
MTSHSLETNFLKNASTTLPWNKTIKYNDDEANYVGT